MKCPGQDTQYWNDDAIFDAPCPECGRTVEFFKDDTTRKCPGCGHRFLNPRMDFGCAAYCRYAEQCVGNLPPELLAQKEDLIKDRVAVEMKRRFRVDFKRIGHASRVARNVDALARDLPDQIAVLRIAAFLHDIDAAADYSGQTASAAAADLLERLGAPPPLIEAVCRLIAGHRGDAPMADGPLAAAFSDAHAIADLEDRLKDGRITVAELPEVIAATLRTDAGRRHAQAVLMA